MYSDLDENECDISCESFSEEESQDNFVSNTEDSFPIRIEKFDSPCYLPPQTECSICFEEVNMISLPECGHTFCQSCVIDYLDTKINEGVENFRHPRTAASQRGIAIILKSILKVGVPCPHRGCKSLVGEDMIRKIISPELLSVFEYILLYQTINQEIAKELTRCPLNCGNFLQKDCFCVNKECRIIQKKIERKEIKRRKKEKNSFLTLLL